MNFSSARAKQPSLLVIDDVPANLDFLIDGLGNEDLQIRVALSGREGLALAQNDSPDLILLDIMMPGMDGYEVCRQLKKDKALADVPVVFLSARGQEPDIELGLALGAIDYVQKPFSLPVLKARIRTHLAHKKRLDELQNLACLDELTGCGNRRTFEHMLELEWFRARRHADEMSLIMIDVDHFKAYNDHYGHVRGDECLRVVAGVLQGVIRRPGDCLARYGGEEFAVILPGTEKVHAERLATEMCTALYRYALPHEASPVADRVTISAGVASVVPDADGHAGSLVTAADRALYQAKKTGRNRASVAAL
ncbi:diguanylate cyclase [uncultured Thalassolituus sp.]|uniref:GGDEF domain-containing protein n=1 Tax=uncultured Thalassolituus sp. TaxID=285273 RepID=UPI002610A056|nr:diguanylate cyclase [uncultured Thalassolituus sp.]